MKKYMRSHIENYILRTRLTDLSKVTDDWMADNLILLRRMKRFLDLQEQSVRDTMSVIKGGKE